jgi:hypothetical protein
MLHLKFCYRLMHENSGASDSAVLLMRQNDNIVFQNLVNIVYLGLPHINAIFCM